MKGRKQFCYTYLHSSIQKYSVQRCMAAVIRLSTAIAIEQSRATEKRYFMSYRVRVCYVIYYCISISEDALTLTYNSLTLLQILYINKDFINQRMRGEDFHHEKHKQAKNYKCHECLRNQLEPICSDSKENIQMELLPVEQFQRS